MHALLLNLFYSNFYVIYRFSNMFMDYQWKKKLKTFLRDVAGTLNIETLRHTQWFQCTCSIYLSQYLVHPLSLIITCSNSEYSREQEKHCHAELNFYKFLIRWKLKSTIETIAYCMWRVYYHLSMTVILNQTEQLQDTNNHPFQIQNKPYNKGMKIQLENELDRPLLVSL